MEITKEQIKELARPENDKELLLRDWFPEAFMEFAMDFREKDFAEIDDTLFIFCKQSGLPPLSIQIINGSEINPDEKLKGIRFSSHLNWVRRDLPSGIFYLIPFKK